MVLTGLEWSKGKMNRATSRHTKALAEMTAFAQARMAAANTNQKKQSRPKEIKEKPAQFDATPERLAKEPDAELMPVRDDRNKAGTVMVRRFRSTHLDRLHKNGKLTFPQWSAGEWYRDMYAAGHPPLRVTAKYGEHVPGGEPDYGLARTDAQSKARDAWKAARAQWSREQQGFMDRLLLRDELPRYGGRRAMQSITFIRNALDEMAGYLRY